MSGKEEFQRKMRKRLNGREGEKKGGNEQLRVCGGAEEEDYRLF